MTIWEKIRIALGLLELKNQKESAELAKLGCELEASRKKLLALQQEKTELEYLLKSTASEKLAQTWRQSLRLLSSKEQKVEHAMQQLERKIDELQLNRDLYQAP